MKFKIHILFLTKLQKKATSPKRIYHIQKLYPKYFKPLEFEYLYQKTKCWIDVFNFEMTSFVRRWTFFRQQLLILD